MSQVQFKWEMLYMMHERFWIYTATKKESKKEKRKILACCLLYIDP